MSDSWIRYAVADGIATITFNRPEKRNAMTASMCAALRAALLSARDDAAVRVVVLEAEGSVFMAGADLSDPPPQFWEALPNMGVQLDKPVIAAVAGPVVGLGVTLVTFCDLCVAADDTRFIYPEAKVGVAMGLISSIVTRIPHKIAQELMLLGEPIGAQRAYEVGMVNRLVPVGEHRAAAQAMAAGLARNAPLVMGMLKRMSAQTQPRGPVEAMYLAQQAVAQVTQSEDAAEGLRAFQEKRAPQFTGR